MPEKGYRHARTAFAWTTHSKLSHPSIQLEDLAHPLPQRPGAHSVNDADLLQFIEDACGEIPKLPETTSWSGVAVFYLSAAVELWASGIHDELTEAIEADLQDLLDRIFADEDEAA